MVFLCRVQPFLAVVAVGSTPVECFSSEAVWPPKGTKMETVRVSKIGRHVSKTSGQGGCGGTVGQERSKINIVIVYCCCHRDIG